MWFHLFYKLSTRKKKLPKNCRDCELLGICRRPASQGWKCFHGCMLLRQPKGGMRGMRK